MKPGISPGPHPYCLIVLRGSGRQVAGVDALEPGGEATLETANPEGPISHRAEPFLGLSDRGLRAVVLGVHQVLERIPHGLIADHVLDLPLHEEPRGQFADQAGSAVHAAQLERAGVGVGTQVLDEVASGALDHGQRRHRLQLGHPSRVGVAAGHAVDLTPVEFAGVLHQPFAEVLLDLRRHGGDVALLELGVHACCGGRRGCESQDETPDSQNAENESGDLDSDLHEYSSVVVGCASKDVACECVLHRQVDVHYSTYVMKSQYTDLFFSTRRCPCNRGFTCEVYIHCFFATLAV